METLGRLKQDSLAKMLFGAIGKVGAKGHVAVGDHMGLARVLMAASTAFCSSLGGPS